jgi:chlorobactene glucosyltransferase
MDSLSTEAWLFIAYLLFGPLFWGAFGFLLAAGRRRMNLLKSPVPAVPDPAPLVTILIPAKDEGERIRACIRSALDQNYPRVEVIAIDDRSVDCTGAVMDEMAAADDRLRVVHIQPGSLPDGWTGKCNAMHTAVRDARGEWLLFVDSDVILKPDALSSCLGVAIRKSFDLLSLVPALESHTFWEGNLVPLAGAAMSVLFVVAVTNNSDFPGIAWANGQFMLFRREAYEKVGGHACVRDQFCEDVVIARTMKAQGLRPRVSWGADAAAVRMYSSLPQIIRGWGRIFFASDTGRMWRILLGIVSLFVCGYSAFAALGWGFLRLLHPDSSALFNGTAWLIAGGIHWILMTLFIGILYTWTHNSRWNALTFPVTALLLLAIFFKALHLCLTGRLVWRGTAYSRKVAA